MKHQERKKRDAYARRYGELVADNVAMEQRIHRLVEDYNRVAGKLRNLEDKYEEVVMELKKAKLLTRNCLRATPTSATPTWRKDARQTASEKSLPNFKVRT